VLQKLKEVMKMSKYVLSKDLGTTAQVILTNTEAGDSIMLGPAYQHIDRFFLHDIITGTNKAELNEALRKEWISKEIEDDVAEKLMDALRPVPTTVHMPKTKSKEDKETKAEPAMSEALASAMTVLEEALDEHKEQPTKEETVFNCDDILADLGIEL
jgi:hypothetical protein